MKGKILNISYTGHWSITLDGKWYRFDTFEDVEIFLKRCIDNAKDESKRELLKEDVKCLYQSRPTPGR